MSIKTLRKRIALVAVSALGAGLLSVAAIAPASAGNQLDANELVPKPIGSGNTYLTACATDATGNVDSAVIPRTSTGLVLGTQLVGSATAAATAYVAVTGPGIISALGSKWSSLSQTTAEAVAAGLGTTATLATSADANDVTITPTGLGTIKVTYARTSTSATLDVITITVVEKCANSALSIPMSKFLVSTETNSLSSVSVSTFYARTTEDDATTVASDSKGYIRMSLRDSYGGALLGTKVLLASVSGANCLVNLENLAASYSEGSGQTDLAADSGYDDVVVVSQDDETVPAKCTVTVSYDGTTVGTKTFTFRGIPAKITVSDVTIGRISASGDGDTGRGFYRVTVQDAADNLLPGVVISASTTESNNAAAIAAGIIVSAQAQTGATTSATSTGLGKTGAITSSTITLASSNTDGPVHYTCGATGGAAKITVRALISAATASYVTSAPFDVFCGGALDTWSISLDKATYAPGEIATLTLSGKDTKGRPVSTFTLLSGVEYAFGGMTAVTAPTNNDAFNSGSGIKTYRFSVGTSEGAFVGTFKTTGATDTAAKTVQYKVAAQTASVTNAEVLAAIVKLIASINKQIRALQKQLRR